RHQRMLAAIPGFAPRALFVQSWSIFAAPRAHFVTLPIVCAIASGPADFRPGKPPASCDAVRFRPHAAQHLFDGWFPRSGLQKVVGAVASPPLVQTAIPGCETTAQTDR